MNAVVTLSLTVAYVAIVCYIACKVMLYFMDKTFALIIRSRAFTMAMFAVFSVLFFVVGSYQFFGYWEGKNLKFSQYFPLFLGLALVMAVSAYFAYKKPKWGED
jgi:hypothetical protein